MTLIIRDSFDFYGTFPDGGQTYWNTFTGSASLTNATRFGVGQALSINGSVSSTILGMAYVNEATIVVGFAMNVPSGGTTQQQVSLQFQDAGNTQCSIYFEANGNILFYRGDQGTLLGTCSGGIPINGWHHYQFKITVNGSTGSFEVRRDGNTVDDFSLTGVNNRGATTNNFSNGFLLKTTNSAIQFIIDDIVICSVDGAGAPWDDWFGDIRAVQLMPSADATPNAFAENASPVSVGNTVGGSSISLNTNELFTLIELQVPPGTCNSISVNFQSAFTGKVTLAIYDSDGPGGIPLTKLANTIEITNPTIGVNVFTISSPPTLAGAHNYWIVASGNGNYTLVANNVLGNVQQYEQSTTYNSTLPSTMSSPSSALYKQCVCTLSMTAAGHFAYVSELLEDGAQTFLSDATVTDKELFTTAGLGFTPPSILGVSLRLFASKSDSGARSGQPTMTSGSTVQDGASTVLSSTYSNIVQIQDVDPATSSAWTPTALNALKIGFKVSA